MLADELIVIDGGRELQAGARRELFAAPASPRVAALLGIANALPGRVSGPHTLVSGGVELRVPEHGLADGREVVWCVRPERVRVRTPGPGDMPDDARDAEREVECNVCTAVLQDEVDLGTVRELTVAVGEAFELTVRGPYLDALGIGAQLRVTIAPRDIGVWALEQADDARAGAS